MKRFTRRILGVVAGLALGWYAQGVVSMAQNHDATSTPNVEQSHVTSATGNDHSREGDQGHGDNPATTLRPHQPHIPWLTPVLVAAAGLFAAAVVLGIPAMKIRGPDPPDPAAGEH